MRIADRVAKQIRNITLKPVQLASSKAQRQHRISTCSNQETLLSPTTNLSFLPNRHFVPITSQSSPLRRADETLEERAMRLLGPLIATQHSAVPTATVRPTHLVSSSSDINPIKSYATSNIKDKKQIINNIQPCLSAMETVRRAADELCQFHRRGVDCRNALNYLFKVHSTAFYLKTATSAEVKQAFSKGLRLPWSDVANSINALKMAIHHEQLFMAEISDDKNISSKIDTETSIAMSSKLAYQLSQLSY